VCGFYLPSSHYSFLYQIAAYFEYELWSALLSEMRLGLNVKQRHRLHYTGKSIFTHSWEDKAGEQYSLAIKAVGSSLGISIHFSLETLYAHKHNLNCAAVVTAWFKSSMYCLGDIRICAWSQKFCYFSLICCVLAVWFKKCPSKCDKRLYL
jgi:hypothetical protein